MATKKSTKKRKSVKRASASKRPRSAAASSGKKAARAKAEREIEVNTFEEANDNVGNRGPAVATSGAGKVSDYDEYLFQAHYDKGAKQYVASVLEIPELVVYGPSREAALQELALNLEDRLTIARNRGETTPLPMQRRTYPENLSIPVSQTLHRKIDTFSKRERIPIDKLVIELLSEGLERRRERRPSGGASSGQRHNRNSGQWRNNHNKRDKNRNYHSGHSGNARQDNFMEYVRNLEKGGYNKK